MARYKYKAVDRGGAAVEGVLEATDRRAAVSSLAGQGRFVTELWASAGDKGAGYKGVGAKGNLRNVLKAGSGRIRGRDLLAVTGQLSTALRAGLPLLKGLEIIAAQQHKSRMRGMLTAVAGRVSAGESLSEAMGKEDGVFSNLYLSMVRVGETGGILDQTTGQLVEIMEREERIKSSMKNASAYPLFVLGLGAVSVVVIVTFILPKILETIVGGAAVMPWPTRFLMWASGVGRAAVTTATGWVLLAAAVAGVIWLWRWVRGAGKMQWDGFKLAVPVLGSVLESIAVGRFTRTLGALTRGGVPILEALRIVRDTLGNEVLGREIDAVAEKVKTGASVAEGLEESKRFPPLLVQIVAIGEQTGQLDTMLLNAADTFDEQADSAIAKFIAIFPAVMILLLAVVIGFIIVAVLLPVVMMGTTI